MSRRKYTEELIEIVLKDLESTADPQAVSERHNVPVHAIYRFRRERLAAPEISKDKKIRELTKELQDKELETRILRELLKKTYQVMPIELK